MNKILKFSFFISFLSVFIYKYSYAQQNHFLYIQADDKQTFSVAVNGKTFNSSDVGYVIIPKLTDGKYQLNVSFPDNKFPDQQFNCVINKNDAGYALKNFNEKGWGLFNLQTLNVTMAGVDVPEIPKDTTNPNAFGEMLSDVMNDTSLKKAGIELQQAERQKHIEGENGGNNLTSIVVIPTLNDSLITAQKADSNATTGNSIMKISEHKTSTGANMVFIDKSTGDTIKVFLPKQAQTEITQQQETENKTLTDTSDANRNVADTTATTKTAVDSGAIAKSGAVIESTKQNNPPQQEVKNENVNPTLEAVVPNNNQPSNPFYQGEKKADTTSIEPANNITETTPSENSNSSSPTVAYKQDCKKMLADNDVDKMKKKMVSLSTDDKMIQTAKKYIENKCLTTDQVKSLGLLFLTDDGRYNFFDAVYKNVYDISAFPSLQSQLIDPYYKKRFQAMLK